MAVRAWLTCLGFGWCVLFTGCGSPAVNGNGASLQQTALGNRATPDDARKKMLKPATKAGKDGYAEAIVQKIRNELMYAGSASIPGNPEAVFMILQVPTGEIVSVTKLQGSGVPEYDRAVENAILKSSPLPKAKDGTVAREISVTFKMKDVH